MNEEPPTTDKDQKDPEQADPEQADPKEFGDKTPPKPGPQPEHTHEPISLAVVNLAYLDDLALHNRKKTGHPRVRESDHKILSGHTLEVTVTLEGGPVVSGESPYVVALEYIVTHGSGVKPAGLYFYKKTDLVTFRYNAPPQGSKVQQFQLQTIRFSGHMVQDGPASVVLQATPVAHGKKTATYSTSFTIDP